MSSAVQSGAHVSAKVTETAQATLPVAINPYARYVHRPRLQQKETLAHEGTKYHRGVEGMGSLKYS